MSRQLTLITCCILLVIGGVCYGDVARDRLLHWDDVSYVFANPFVQEITAANLRHIFFGFTLDNWHPLTWLSFMLNYATGTATVPGLKLTNLLFHCATSLALGLLTTRVLRIAQGNPGNDNTEARLAQLAGCFTAVLYCIHPQHVESVTWVVERKDLLCALFYFLALDAYLGQKRTSGASAPSSTVVVFAFLALLSKPMAVTLPAGLLVLDIFPLRNVRKGQILRDLLALVLAKWVLILLAICVIFITLIAQSPQPLEAAPPDARLWIALQALGFYIRQFIWPFEFVPFHPFSHYLQVVPILAALGAGFLIILCASSWRAHSSTVRGAVFSASAFYLLTLLPVLGLVKVGEQAFADRYAYIPTAPAYIACGWLAAKLALGSLPQKGKILAVAMGLLLCCGLIVQTRSVTAYWDNDAALWKRVLEVYPRSSAVPHNNIGNVHFEKGDLGAAAQHYRTALEIQPTNLIGLRNLILTEQKRGQTQIVFELLGKMLTLHTENPFAWSWAGEMLMTYQDPKTARTMFERALALNPRLDVALFGLARVHQLNGDIGLSQTLLVNISRGSAYFDRAQRMLGMP